MNVLKLLGSNAPVGGTPRSISYVTTAQNTSNLTSYTFSGISLGTVDSTRLIVVAVYGHNTINRTISGVTVGGASATLVGKMDGALSNSGLYQIENTTDATADIEVTFSGQELRAAIVVWALYGLSSTTKEAYNDNFTSTNNSVSASLFGTSNGVAVAFSSINTTGRAATWTSMAENNEVTLEAAVQYSAAFRTLAPSALSPSVNWGVTTNKTIIAARWF